MSDNFKSQNNLSGLLENLSDVLFKYTVYPEYKIEYISPSVFELTGYTQEEFYSDPFLGYKTLHPEDAGIKNKSIETIKKNNVQEKGVASGNVELRMVKKDGSVIWTETINKVVKNDKGIIISVEGATRDITSRKKLELEAKNAAKNYKNLLENMPCAVVIFNNEGILFANQLALRMVGIEPTTEQLNREISLFDFIDQDYHDVIKLRQKRLLEGEAVLPIEIKIKQKEGGSLFVESNSSLVD